MDFFEHQDAARRNTGRLVILFLLALAAIVTLVYGLVVVSLFTAAELRPTGLWMPQLFLGTAAGVLTVVGLGSLVRTARLGKGGSRVAERLGGRRLDPSSWDPMERRVLNVVEEMAIASGTPVPPVYMLDDPGINAFAAGHDPSDTVIGVTRGAVEKLDRDELQGVMAHEFSHVLHGDVGLNLRLMGLVFGIELLAHLGRFLVEGTVRTSYVGGRKRNRDRDWRIVAVGAGLWAIGWVGAFFGNLIRAAVSRQREFLADAAAVQFTRNPDGVAGALKKIGGLSHGSAVAHPRRAEMSHMFFGNVLARARGAAATHPPLEERIRRVDPDFDGFERVADDYVAAWNESDALAGFAGATVSDRTAGPEPRTLLEQLGEPGPEHLTYARRLLDGIPEDVHDAALDPARARELSLALIRGDEPAGRIPPASRLPLLDSMVATLQGMTADEYAHFRKRLEDASTGSGGTDLHEWALVGLLLHRLDAHFGLRPVPRSRYGRLEGLERDVSLVLSALAREGHHDEPGAQAAFAAARSEIELPALAFVPETVPRAVEGALDTLTRLNPELKRRLLSACAVSVAEDGRVTATEAELFRLVADWIGCPTPPLLPGQRLR